MDNPTSKFFDKHKAWLDRNKEYLESSDWDTKSIIPKPPSKAVVKKDGAGTNTTSKVKTNIASAITDAKKTSIGNDNAIVKNLLGRLTYFMKSTKGEKHLERNKKVTKYILDVIEVFVDRCGAYLDNNLLTDISDQEIRNLEIKFQDLVFSSKINIEDTLDSLGAYVEHEDTIVKFYRDDKASLILRAPLVLLNDDVKLITERIPVDWNIAGSNEMYINMKPKDIPKWNSKKHFFDQELSTIQFWQEELNKITNGFTVGGYFIHPWMYFHLNYFKTPIPQEDGTEPTTQPSLRDNEWFFAENLKACIHPDNPAYFSKAMLVYGTRRFAKSVIMASLAHWKILTKFNASGTIVGGSSSDLGALVGKVKTSMTYMERAFALDVTTQSWDNGETFFGIKEDISNAIIYSTLVVQNLQDGAKSKTQKTAGLAPSVSIYDEIGKYAFLKPYLAALPSFKTPYGFKCITVLAGTGGEADLSADAMEVLNNPEAYDLLPMNWDLLESKIDPEQITWKRRRFATFFPGQMAYEEGFIKKPKPFSEFLEIDNEVLAKIDIHLTDWEKNNNFLEAKLVTARAMRSTKGNLLEQQRKVQYPRDPEDCFITLEGNPFPSAEAKTHKEWVIATGQQGRKVILSKNSKGVIEDTPAEYLQEPQFPFPGGFIDSPVILHEPLPETTPPFGLYIVGLDDYKHEQSDGDSVGSFTVYKREWMDKWSLRVVATYAARPNPQTKFHRQGYYLIKAFNGLCFPENEDMNFKTYLDKKHETDVILMKGLDFASQFNLNNNGNRAFGWNPTTKNIAFGLGLLVNYTSEELTIIDEHGQEQSILGVQRINDVGILEEIQNFTKDGNFDRLRSFMSALMYAHYLDTIFMVPKQPSVKAEATKTLLKQKNKAHPYSKSSGKPYRK